MAKSIIATVNSIAKARRVVDEIIVKGRFTATAFHDGFVIYTRIKDNETEELYVNRKSAHLLEVVKEVKEKRN